jgi:tRNA-Thr(GGU) m(6)t(6)A37 methyltransferase TsaA
MLPGCPLEVIGVVHTARSTPASTPVQAALNRAEHGMVEIFEGFAEGLSGLEEFDYVWLLTWMHLASGSHDVPPMTQVPFLLRPQRRTMGVFATRGPHRVNPIGLSLVNLLEVAGRTIRFAGVDLVDGTAVVDLKPFVTRFDSPPSVARCGWFDSVEMVEAVTPADLDPGLGGET